uniref:CCHC-type domain-containing protein n=1 Tax=Tanacetum cinerariifolium TaxID=118510 RepID=A0A699I9J7_TANCI|nr:hypothetical protein [Tanacetum cinerariifolium]
MLVESNYESWKIRIERYIHVTEGQGAAAVQVTRDKTDEEFTEIENNRELANIQATNILSQGLPRHLDIPTHQINTKFVNNLPPYWAKYVTNVKNNKDISLTTYVELYTYLKSYEPHALKTLKKQEQSSSIVDPLAHLASTTHHLTPTQPTNPPPSTSSLTLPPQPATQSSNDAMLATMNQIVNLLSGFQKQFPPTNNQLRTSSNLRSHATVHDEQIVTETIQRKASSNVGNIGTRGTQSYGQVTENKGKLVICYNCRGEGHVSSQCKEKKRVKDSQYFKDKMLLREAKEKRAVLDAEAEAFLADVECTAPYDQPLAIMTTNIFKVSHEDAYNSKVHTDDNQIFDNVNHLLAHEMHQEEHLDSDVESDINYNTIPYHQYQLDSEVQDVPIESLCSSEGTVPITGLLVTVEELVTQKSNPPKPVTPFVHTHPAPKLVQSLDENLVKEVTEFMRIFDELDKEYEQCVLERKKLKIEKKNLLIQNECLITDCIAKDICSIVLASDKDRPLSKELSLNCVRENSKVIELEPEILKQQQMLAESDKRCSFIQKNHIDLQIKFRNYKECLKNQTICDNSHSLAVNAVFEINQLKEQLQGKDDTIRKLQTQINSMSMLNVEPTVGSFHKQALENELTQLKDAITSVGIQNDGFKVENVNLKQCYQELSTSNSHSRDTLTRKLTALTAENGKLKSESFSKMHSEPIVPKKPKVLAPGMYVISFKYIVPPRRVNRVKPATGASKPMSKSDTQNHSILPAKREKARRVEDHHRNLNK